ncbi:MAG TPA: DUF3274 domain-containing protein [Paraburkholderia sp.]|nr:DUF3274 domain-containing protein [Paraburkholderia sp.]
MNVDAKHRYPCTTILIHGVNDLGADFGTVEAGLCKGLNERLGRGDFVAAEYSHGRMANSKKKVSAADLMKDLDDVIYRRTPTDKTVSPLIPFYWGFKANKDDLSTDPGKQVRNGQNVDKFGNRLDKNLAKNGGMFANATNNIPDIFATHFRGGVKTWALNKLQADPTHPLYEAPNRHYMVLAAKRLAALVRQIRVFDPNETVNIIAHSQGTIISLLAQAFLVEGLCGSHSAADRPADTLILIDSPYSLSEEVMDQITQTGDSQQTAYARAKTLSNLVGLVKDARHAEPTLDSLEVGKGVCKDNYGITGPAWGAKEATRLQGPSGTKSLAFAERDNRGHVYIYFSPEDATVGLTGVNGMGCLGLPDSRKATSAQGQTETITLLSDSFTQRVFTRRQRQGKAELVGTKPHQYVLRESGESAHGTSRWDQFWKRTSVDVGTSRNINAPDLPPPFPPQMEGNVIDGTQKKSLFWRGDGEFAPGQQSLDEIEASIAVSVTDLKELDPVEMAWPAFIPGKSDLPAASQVQEVLNQGKDTLDQCSVERVFTGLPLTPGKIWLIRKETPNEAKLRWMNEHQGDSSYHSAVMSGEENHRNATAFDVSLGQAKVLDDADRAEALRAIADWRNSITTINRAGKGAYKLFDEITKRYVDATLAYYSKGAFPSESLVPVTPPHGVVSEQIHARMKHAKEMMANSPMNYIPLP